MSDEITTIKFICRKTLSLLRWNVATFSLIYEIL